jgi:glycerol-3-phosphate acyltransferase PlsY
MQSLGVDRLADRMAPAIAYLLLTYLIASIPFAVVLATLYGGDTDVRTAGSGNPGATNVARLYGWRLGAAVMACDIGKGALPVLLARLLWPELDPWWSGTVAIVAFVAHVFPAYLEFKGGKGVATGAGAMLALAPVPTLVAAAVWGAVLGLTGRSSVAALCATFAMVGLALWWSPVVLPLVILLAAAITITHTPNLRRLWRGEEGSVVRPVRWTRAATPRGAQALEEGPAGPGSRAPAAWREPDVAAPDATGG